MARDRSQLLAHTTSKRPRRRWFQFSLGALLTVITIAGMWLGWYVGSVHRQRQALAAIAVAGGEVYHRHQLDALRRNQKPLLPGPEWLRSALGDDYFRTAIKVQVYHERATDLLLAEFPKLPHLDEVLIQGPFTGAGLRQVFALPRLTSVGIYGSAITDDDLRHLAAIPRLEILHLNCPQVTDEGLRHLQGLRGLRLLVLGGNLSDKGLHHLQTLSGLESLTCVTRPHLEPKLHEGTVVDCVDVSLPDILEHLQDYHKVPFRIDEDAISAAGLNADLILLTGTHGGSLRDVLQATLSPHHLDWTTDATHFVITTAAAAEEGRPGVRRLQRSLPNLMHVEIDW